MSVGFAVAGGKSARMGRDKALLPWRGTTLLDHALDRLRRTCPEVRILCGPEPRYGDRGVPVVLDAIPDGGRLVTLEAVPRHDYARRSAAAITPLSLPLAEGVRP